MDYPFRKHTPGKLGKSKKMTEVEVRKSIIDFLKKLPDRCTFTVHTKPRGKFVSSSWPPVGWSDISGHWLRRAYTGPVSQDPHYAPVPLYIEVKTPDGVISIPQMKFIDARKKEGCIAFFADSVQAVRDNLGLI